MDYKKTGRLVMKENESVSSVDLFDLRVRLDQMTERIVSRLKDRSRLPLNGPVYTPDGVQLSGRKGLSLLQVALEGLDNYHALLGRFEYHGQTPLLGNPTTPPVAERATVQVGILPVQVRIVDDLLAFYLELVPDLASPGDDPTSYGETVYIDADLLQHLNERVQLGCDVAAAKLQTDSGLLLLWDSPEKLSERLRSPRREAALLASARTAATRYEVSMSIVDTVFRWLIQATVRVECLYVREAVRTSRLVDD